MKVLKPEWEEIQCDFFRLYRDHRRVCFIGCAPCPYCTHDGNPLNLEETEEAWEEIFDVGEACESALNRLEASLEKALKKHLFEMFENREV